MQKGVFYIAIHNILFYRQIQKSNLYISFDITVNLLLFSVKTFHTSQSTTYQQTILTILSSQSLNSF